MLTDVESVQFQEAVYARTTGGEYAREAIQQFVADRRERIAEAARLREALQAAVDYYGRLSVPASRFLALAAACGIQPRTP